MGGLGHVLSIHLFQHHPGIAAVADITVTIDAAVREAAQEPPQLPLWGGVRMHEGVPLFHPREASKAPGLFHYKLTKTFEFPYGLLGIGF
jgi:hypothetical protein